MELIRELPALGRNLGPGLIAIGVASITAIIVGIIFQEWEVIKWMLLVPLILCSVGAILRFLPKKGRKEPRSGSSIAATAVIWMFVGLCGALPFLYIEPSYLNSAFESISAWTGTGFTVTKNIESWPKTLLFWRSFMQWIGGLGIIALALTIGKRSGLLKRGLYRSEGRTESFMPSVLATAFQMWKIYAILTVVAFVAILLTGVSAWDSINLSLCAISTGGLSIYAEGIAHFDNFALEMVLIPIMIAGAIPFRLYYLAFNRRSFREILRDRILHVILIIFAVISIITILDLTLVNGFSFEQAFREGVFTAGSTVSSTGFQNTTFSGWGIAPIILFGIFMLIGGAQGSTAGGFKIDRLLIILESIVWWIKRVLISPKAVVYMRHNRKSIKGREAFRLVMNSFILLLFYIIIIIITYIVFIHDPYFATNSAGTFFDILSCIGNNGATSGMIGPSMPDYAKIVIIFEMWIARLEIIPVMILVWGMIRGFNWESITKKNHELKQ